MNTPTPDAEPAVSTRPGPTIRVTQNGPYLVDGGLEVRSAEGQTLDAPDRYALCRCGGSANKPFCDGTHARIGFRLRSKPGTRLVACGDPRPGTTPSQRQEVPSRALGTSESVADRIGLSSSV